jgi:hypothetical protein
MTKTFLPRTLLIPAFCLSLFALTGTASGDATITVQNSNDSGPGSLRQAVLDARSLHPNEHTTINFSSKVFAQTITLTSGEILLPGNITIDGPGADLLTISGNDSSRIFTIPGGVSVSIGGLTLFNGFAPGQSGGHGGAILNAGILTIEACAFAGNSVEGSTSGNGHGGAIENSNRLNAGYCTFNNNSAQGGGAIYNGPGGSCYLALCTFTKNSAIFKAGGGGGAILHRGALLDVSDTTISENLADGAGAGVYTSDVPKASSHIRNTIIARNNAATSPDTYGAYTSDGYNLVGVSDAGNGFTLSSDHSGTAASPLNAGLGSLASNGGPVQTMALGRGSPALDQGKSNSTTDQRGFIRRINFPGISSATGGDSSDIGAFELTAPSALLNISTRLRVLTNDNALIGGFIITGSQAKKVIIRGIGPSLAASGVQGALADPIIELHQSESRIALNDDWKETQRAEIEASTIPPSNDLESAIVALLRPGAYTAVLRGKNDTVGVGSIEVYDLDQAADATLANISTRGFVDTGDNVLIGGFIAGGSPGYNDPARVLIRGIGPSLQDFGVANALADPTLELHNGQGALIQSNDNWKEEPAHGEGAFAFGLAPTRDAESAIFVILAPGNYTAILRGKNNSTGVGVVEVYNLR